VESISEVVQGSDMVTRHYWQELQKYRIITGDDSEGPLKVIAVFLALIL